jgi:hypothetical protein
VAGCVSNQPWVTVVGIVKNIKYADLDTAVPHIYTSIYQRSSRILSLMLRSPLAPSRLEPSSRKFAVPSRRSIQTCLCSVFDP